MNFAKRLKQLREERCLRQEDLAKILNISRQSISNYENGSRFPNDEELIKKLSRYFDVSIDYLLGATSIRKNFSTDNNCFESKEKLSTYTSDKNKAIEYLFQEIDDLPSEVIKKIAEAIRLFKSIQK